MKKNLLCVKVSILLLFLTLGCEDEMSSSGNDSSNKSGEVIINNLPYGYAVSYCEVSTASVTELKWSNSSNGSYATIKTISDPFYNDIINYNWELSINGSGSISDKYNCLNIWSMRYYKQGDYIEPSHSNSDYLYTGTGNIYVSFSRRPDLSGNFYQAYNRSVLFDSVAFSDVQFKDGKAEIDFKDAAFFPPNLPETQGLLTLTGLEGKHIGKYIFLTGSLYNNWNNDLYGIKNASSYNQFKGIEIKSDSVDIPIYRRQSDELFFNTVFNEYSYTFTPYSITIYIRYSENIDYSNYWDIGSTSFETITFTSTHEYYGYEYKDSGIEFIDWKGTADYYNRVTQ